MICTKLNYCSLSLIVPTDEEGVIPSALEKAVVQHNATHAARPLSEKKPYRGMVYLIPTFHNPTGKCLPAGKLCWCVCVCVCVRAGCSYH